MAESEIVAPVGARLCRALLEPLGLPGDALEAIVAQALRVLSRVAGPEELARIGGPGGIIKALASSRVYSRKLEEAIAEGNIPLDLRAAPGAPSAFALAFAVCVFPRQYRHNQNFQEKVRAFARALNTLSQACDLSFTALARTRSGLVPSDLDRFLAWLTAARWAPGIHEKERSARLTGASLYLLTCHLGELQKMGDYCSSQGPLLEFFQTRLATPLTEFARDAAGEGIVRGSDAVVEFLVNRHHWPRDCCTQAMAIERWVRLSLGRFYRGESLEQALNDFWEEIWAKLVSGFPYYAFCSKLRTCICSWAVHHRIRRPPSHLMRLLARIPAESGEEEEEERSPFFLRGPLTPERLRLVREGYRICRVHTCVDEAGEDGDRARANERKRLLLDRVFAHMIVECGFPAPDPAMQGGPRASPGREGMREIQRAFPELGRQASLLKSRLTQHLRAYLLARESGLGNERIVALIGGAPSLRSIANLGRAVRRDHTSLWAFLTRLAWHRRIDSRHPDPWPFRRVVREIGFWVRDPLFGEAWARGVLGGNPADEALLREIEDGSPLGRLVQELRGLGPGGLEAFLRDPSVGDLERLALDACSRLAGRCGLADPCASCARPSSASSAQTWNRWVAPVWYLFFVEAKDESSIRERLNPDLLERPVIRQMGAKFSSCQDCPRIPQDALPERWRL